MPEEEIGGLGSSGGAGGGEAEGGSSWWDDFWDDVGDALEPVKQAFDDNYHPKHHHHQKHHEHWRLMPEPVRTGGGFAPSAAASPPAHDAYNLWRYHFPTQHPGQHLWGVHQALKYIVVSDPQRQWAVRDNPRAAAAMYDARHPGAHMGLDGY